MATSDRKIGAIGYDKDLFLRIIQQILPTGTEDWSKVADKYFEQSGEKELRSHVAIKRYWWDTMCEKMKKVTGEGKPKRLVGRSQEVQVRYFFTRIFVC